jgi:hypothetical protein
MYSFCWRAVGFYGRIVCASLVACLSSVAIISSAMAKELKATPYRPTVSNPAYLPVPNYLEVEMGWQSLKAKSTERHRHSIPYLLKYAFTDRIGVLLRGSPVVVEDRAGRPTQTGFGDTTGLIKLVHPLNTIMPSALGLEGGIKFPSAPRTVGTGRTDFLANGIYSIAFGQFGLDLNLLYTRLGGALGAQGENELGWVTTASYSVTDRVSVAGEFFGSHREGVRPFLQYLSALSYAITPRVVGDAGVAVGLTGASQEWTLFTGLTILTWSPL